MAYYSRPEEILQHFKDLFDARKELFGFAYVAIQGENLLPEYPALEIASGGIPSREIHGTYTFLLNFEVNFWIYHANYESTHAQREMENLELTTKIVRFLHQRDNRTLQTTSGEQKILFGFVTQEIPGVTIAGQELVATTRIVWAAQTEVRFDDS